MPPAARQALGLTAGPLASAIHEADGMPGKTSHSDTGLTYPDEPTTAAENVAWLWRADLGDALPRAELEPGAWSDASLRWLVDPGRRPDSGPTARVRIGMTDVERFRTTVGLFAQLDDRFGGGHARQSLVQGLARRAPRGLAPAGVVSAAESEAGRALPVPGGRPCGRPLRRAPRAAGQARTAGRLRLLRRITATTGVSDAASVLTAGQARMTMKTVCNKTRRRKNGAARG
jgi:hypothetical protein